MSETQPPPPPAPLDEPAALQDPVRDRIRVVLDRAIYAGALWALVHLQTIGKLDGTMVAAILLVAGVRPHNLFEAARAASKSNGNGRASLLLVLAPILDSLRSGSWLAR